MHSLCYLYSSVLFGVLIGKDIGKMGIQYNSAQLCEQDYEPFLLTFIGQANVR